MTFIYNCGELLPRLQIFNIYQLIEKTIPTYSKPVSPTLLAYNRLIHHFIIRKQSLQQVVYFKPHYSFLTLGTTIYNKFTILFKVCIFIFLNLGTTIQQDHDINFKIAFLFRIIPKSKINSKLQ